MQSLHLLTDHLQVICREPGIVQVFLADFILTLLLSVAVPHLPPLCTADIKHEEMTTQGRITQVPTVGTVFVVIESSKWEMNDKRS